MRKNGESPQTTDTSDREKHIEWCREHLPEGTTIYTIIRGNNLVESRHTLSCLIARVGEDGLPTIEIIDEQVATILGYKIDVWTKRPDQNFRRSSVKENESEGKPQQCRQNGTT